MRGKFAIYMALLSCFGGMAEAENHALLIGASTYSNLEERFWLKGPANDVKLVATYLKSNPSVPFLSHNIKILADGVQGAEDPTLQAIRDAFSALSDRLQPGDFVYLHFSGHGSQSPAPTGSDELDGLDEMFLPVDVGTWQDEIGVVPNALIDDEIGQLIDILRSKGADVWVVFDSCHSGTATRAAPADGKVRLRKLEPAVLGIPELILEKVTVKTQELASKTGRAEAPIVPQNGAHLGSLTAFFAAQTDETTPEKNMPKGAEDRKVQGVFTYVLFETLAEHTNLTYRQLGQEILRKYSVKNHARSTPMFEGDLDGFVFGQGDGQRVLQWPIEKTENGFSVGAGSLHGLTKGSELILLTSPADEDEEMLGTFVVTSVNVFRSVVRPINNEIEFPKGAVLRKTTDVVDFSLKVALPPGGSVLAEKLSEVVKEISRLKLLSNRVEFVPAGQDADLILGQIPNSPEHGALYFLPNSGFVDVKQIETLMSISITEKSVPELAEVLADSIRRIVKATNLLKIGELSSGRIPIEARFTKARFDPDLDEVIVNSRSFADDLKVPRLVPNDVIGLHLKNNVDYPVDYNILYIGSDYAVSFMGNGRMLPGSELNDDFVLVTDAAFGKDRLLVILTPSREQGEIQDLSFLEQAPLSRTRSTGLLGISGLLDDAGFGETTRAAVSLSSRKKKTNPPAMILQFEVETVPRL